MKSLGSLEKTQIRERKRLLQYTISPKLMSSQISVSRDMQKIRRPRANFPPNIWKNLLLENASISMELDSPMGKHFMELKETVRQMIIDDVTLPSDKLRLIDEIQRLGIFYHFEDEIENELKKMNTNPSKNNGDNDMYTVALQFRLLRQQGYHAPSDVFSKFKDDVGNFKSSLICDIPGMLCLYEASHLSIPGEDILDEALAFTSFHLKGILPYLKDDLRDQVSRALNRPIFKELPRLEAVNFLSLYDKDESHNRTLLKFARLDYNNLQSMHQKELGEILKWWEEIDCEQRLPFVRDRPVEAYFWTMGVYFEPKYSTARMILAKVMGTTSLLDDCYDAYGTVEELELFTEAIERWSPSCIESLPEYMQLIYTVLLDVYTEAEKKIKQERSFCIHYGKEMMKKVCHAYFREAEWCSQSYIPTMEEYMDNALVTSCYPMLIANSFIGMEETADKEAFEWISKIPPMARDSALIGRLINDIASHKFEQERGHVASAVECYMKQHAASEEHTIGILRKQVAESWKEMNKDMLKPNVVHRQLLTRVLNFARVIDVVYKDDDGYTNSHLLKGHIASLMIIPTGI